MAFDIHSRLRHLADRKAKQDRLLEDLRNGAYDGIINASEHFRRREEAAPAGECAPPVKPVRRGDLLDAFPGAEWREAAGGRVLYRRTEYGAGAGGQYSLGIGALQAGEEPIPTNALHLLSRDFEYGESVPLESICFVDTETTGLMGATGTLAFLVGLGAWERRGDGWVYVLEQFLVEDFCHEPALFALLVERLGAFTTICSYNGRSYDVPLLRARAILQRIPPRHFRHRQVDLLHPARRLWKEMLPSVSLKTVESQVLGIDRGPDIDGSLIPATFFHLARTGQPGRMPAVVDHNAQDIMTLSLLLRHLSEVAADPLGCGRVNHWAEFAAVSRWLETRRELELAVTALERALERCNDRTGAEERLLLRLASLHKKRRHWPAAVSIWEDLRGRVRGCWIELAKYHERVRRDPAAALEVVRACRRAADLEMQLASWRGLENTPGAASLLEDMRRREERLRKRLARTTK